MWNRILKNKFLNKYQKKSAVKFDSRFFFTFTPIG